MDWETPQYLFDELNAEFNFKLDAASNGTNAKCPMFYTEQDDGLSKSWNVGGNVFCNPPYGRNVYDWVKKAYEESLVCKHQIVLLIPARTDTKYFHEFIYHKAEIRFLKGRLHFESNGVPSKNAATFPTMIVIYNGKHNDGRSNYSGETDLVI